MRQHAWASSSSSSRHRCSGWRLVRTKRRRASESVCAGAVGAWWRYKAEPKRVWLEPTTSVPISPCMSHDGPHSPADKLACPHSFLPLLPCSAELASKLKMLEGKLLQGEQRGGLDQLARQTAAQLSRQEAELKRQRAAEAEAARRIAALEANAAAVQTHTRTLQVEWGGGGRILQDQSQLSGAMMCCAGLTLPCTRHLPTPPHPTQLPHLPQEEAEAVTGQLDAAEADLRAARAELGDVYAQWERDREELVEQIRWVA